MSLAFAAGPVEHLLVSAAPRRHVFPPPGRQTLGRALLMAPLSLPDVFVPTASLSFCTILLLVG